MQSNKSIKINNNVPNMRFICTLLLITSLFLTLACKKEKKNEAPVINSLYPQANITLNAIDSVRVKVNIADDYGPLTVSVYIVNEQLQVFTTSMVKTFSGSEINIDEFYFFNNKYFETGIYYLVIHADDGENIVNKFIKVNIIGIQRALKSVYVGVRDLSGLKIYCIDNSAGFNQVGYISKNIISSCVNSYSEQISFLSDDGNLISYSLPDFQEVWQKTGLTAPGHVFKGEAKVYENYTYVTDANGYIYGYDNMGNVKKMNSITSGAPIFFNFCDNNLFAFVEENLSSNYSIQLLYPNGGLISKYMINFLPYNILSHDANSVIVWGKSLNNIQMYTYYTEINNLQTFGNQIVGLYNYAIETWDNQYLLSVGNELRLVEKFYGNSTIYASGNKADFMKFEDISKYLYLVDSNNISVLNYPNSTVLNNYNFNEKIVFIDYYYNK
ncbi:MAG: hypothetical protein HY951_07655 [Bacteroidia bacterium]|nr:hypothetical protein [Bacteroidia bacterium]